MSNKNRKQSVVKTGNPLMALEWLIVYVLTGGHPEQANTNKIGNRKTDVIVFGSIFLIAVAIIIYIVAFHKL